MLRNTREHIECAQNHIEWWNVRRTARYLGMSEAFVRKFVRLRRIPFTKVGSKAIRFSKTQLDSWLEGGTK